MTYSFGDTVQVICFDSSWGSGLNQTSIGNYCRLIPMPLPNDIKAGDKVCFGYTAYGASAGSVLKAEIVKANISGTGVSSTEHTTLTTAITGTGNVTLGTSTARKNDVIEMTITAELVTHVQGGNCALITWYIHSGSGWNYVTSPVVYLRRT